MTKQETPNTPSLDYESAYRELEQIVERMETGKQSLESSLTDFERGVFLMKICHEKLQTAEQKVDILIKDNQGILNTAPLQEN